MKIAKSLYFSNYPKNYPKITQKITQIFLAIIQKIHSRDRRVYLARYALDNLPALGLHITELA